MEPQQLKFPPVPPPVPALTREVCLGARRCGRARAGAPGLTGDPWQGAGLCSRRSLTPPSVGFLSDPAPRAALISGPRIHRATTLSSGRLESGNQILRMLTTEVASSARAQNCGRLEKDGMQSRPVGGTGTVKLRASNWKGKTLADLTTEQ